MINKDRRLLLIMNPKSGTMQASKMLSDIVQKYSDSGYLTSILLTGGRGDARQWANVFLSEKLSKADFASTRHSMARCFMR